MAVDVERSAPSLPQNAADPDVKIPDSVRRAAAAAEAIHAQAYQTPTVPPSVAGDAPVDPTNTAPINIVDEVPPVSDPRETARRAIAAKKTAAKEVPVAQPPVAQVEVPPVELTREAAPPAEPVDESQWEHRYRSMKGRYDASQSVIGQMQEQMTLLGQELSRTQHLMMQGTQPQTQPKTRITDADKQAYGDDLIDLTRRAAQDAVQPQLDALTQENQRLQQNFLRQQQQGVTHTLDAEVPNWREINKSNAFKTWLSLPDIYSGVVRNRMINDAYAAASAPRVLAFFKGFIQDEVATGNIEPPDAVEQPPVPRQAAVPLERIAAPGKARPAGGNPPSHASETPIFTHAQIARFYSHAGRQAYVGREKDRAADEQLIFAAQREGRIR